MKILFLYILWLAFVKNRLLSVFKLETVHFECVFFWFNRWDLWLLLLFSLFCICFFNKAHCREDYVLKRRGNVISVLINCLFIYCSSFVCFWALRSTFLQISSAYFWVHFVPQKNGRKVFSFCFFSILEWRTDKENNILIRFRVFSRDFLSIEQPTISKVVGCKNSNVKLVGLSCS